jgi:hypothetical protein
MATRRLARTWERLMSWWLGDAARLQSTQYWSQHAPCPCVQHAVWAGAARKFCAARRSQTPSACPVCPSSPDPCTCVQHAMRGTMHTRPWQSPLINTANTHPSPPPQPSTAAACSHVYTYRMQLAWACCNLQDSEAALAALNCG